MNKSLMLCASIAILLVGTKLLAQQASTGPEHALLKLMEGTWDATIKSSAGDSKGSSVAKLDLGGLWLMEEFKGDFGGIQFQGRGATTYDPIKKKFVNVWIDSMTPSPTISEGAYDQATKTFTLVGNMTTPDGQSMKITQTTKTLDADTRIFTLKAKGADGNETEMMQITYKRRAK